MAAEQTRNSDVAAPQHITGAADFACEEFLVSLAPLVADVTTQLAAMRHANSDVSNVPDVSKLFNLMQNLPKPMGLSLHGHDSVFPQSLGNL